MRNPEVLDPIQRQTRPPAYSLAISQNTVDSQIHVRSVLIPDLKE